MNLEDEVICGHLVTAKKKRANAVYLDLLQEFDRLCKQTGLTYWVCFGALIGAVRHKGFIPWDDDVDVVMPRRDFDRLMAMTQAEFGANAPYFLQNPKTDPAYVETLIRFRRGDTTAVSDDDLWHLERTKWKPPISNMGLCVAIFPLDNVPQSHFQHILKKRIAYVLMGIDYRACRPAREKPFPHAVCSAIEALIGKRNIMSLIHKCFRCTEDNKSGAVQCQDGFYPQSTVWNAEDFSGTATLPFEDITIRVPCGYDRILTTSYGNYMEFPPPDQRTEPHDLHIDPDTPYLESIERLKREKV